MAYDTAGNIVSDAAVQLGLGAIADAWASTDANVTLLRSLLKDLGQDLVKEREWSHLRSEYQLGLVGQERYPLPTDFRALVEQTGWNRTTRFPVNAVSAQEYSYLMARPAGVTLQVLFRPYQGELQVYPASATGQQLAFEYISTSWVRQDGDSFPTFDAPVRNSDFCHFDRLLLVRGLKLAFLRSKGFDSTAVQQDYERTLAQVASDDSPAPVLSLHRGNSLMREPLLSGTNIPLTGFGK